METFTGPSVLIAVAAVILVLKYRRDVGGRQALRVTATAAGRIAIAAAFLAGCARAWAPGRWPCCGGR